MHISRLFTLAALLASMLLTGCGGNASQYEGTWIEAASDYNEPQGITLGRNGWAASVNKPLVQYSHWSAKKGILILEGKLFADGDVAAVSDTFVVERIGSETMWLRKGPDRVRYFKQ
ncbi:MAG: hypothetical protein IJU81_04885 [Bacteroidales bacterium]|nr:hypothetical protein [Bacteroidales bacterium]